MCPMILGFASTAISAAGSVMGGMMARSQASAQSAAYKRQANMELLQGEYQAQRKQDEINQLTGQQIAGTAASGVQLEGSPTDVIRSTVSEGAMDVGTIKWNARTASDTLKYKADLSDIEGKNAMAGGIMGGVGSLVSGLGKMGSQAKKGTYLGNVFGAA